MNADIKVALQQLSNSWHCFEHNGEQMTKYQVKTILEHGLKQGYKTTNQFKEGEIDCILNELSGHK